MTEEEKKTAETEAADSTGTAEENAKGVPEETAGTETPETPGTAETPETAETDDAEAEADGKKSKHKEKEKDRKRRELEAKLKETGDALAASEDKYLRLAAEYDNFRRRSAKEREGIYGDAYAEALTKILPTLDNLERASQYTDPEKLSDGVKLILKGVPDVLASLGVEMFGEPGDVFDPAMHSAVAMAEESEQEPGHIVSVWQKGYRRGDKILRYAAVTVAGEKS